jgi:transcription initiation factor TFIIIB Brf1 subunit/transcription initiation factor TFIIB
MSEKALLKKLEAERAEKATKVAELQARIGVLDSAIESLRVLTGEKPARRGASKATGTKALILDVLADGRRRNCREIAAIAQVTPEAVRLHVKDLVAAGDVDRQGKSRSTTYGIP